MVFVQRTLSPHKSHLVTSTYLPSDPVEHYLGGVGNIRIWVLRSQSIASLINFIFFAMGTNGGPRNSCHCPIHTLAKELTRNRSIQAQLWSHGLLTSIMFLPPSYRFPTQISEAKEKSFFSSTPHPGRFNSSLMSQLEIQSIIAKITSFWYSVLPFTNTCTYFLPCLTKCSDGPELS